MAAESGSLHTPPDCVCGSLGKERECLSSSPYYSGAHLLYVMQFVFLYCVRFSGRAPKGSLLKIKKVLSCDLLYMFMVSTF